MAKIDGYNTKGQKRDIATLLHYEKMAEQGYMPIHDITEADHGKKAVLSGTISRDWISSKKENEPVRLVCNDGKIGYQKPRQRTRFYYAPIDADLFIKITE